MTWAFALSLLERAGTGALTWLGNLKFWQVVCLALAVFGGIQTMRVWAEQRHSAKVEKQLAKCDAARHADQQRYAKAQADAQAANKAQVTKVEQQYQRISEDAEKQHESDLARLHAELNERLRALPQGAPVNPGASPPPATPGKPDATPRVCIPTSQYVLGAEHELQLDQLITYVEQITGVDPNK